MNMTEYINSGLSGEFRDRSHFLLDDEFIKKANKVFDELEKEPLTDLSKLQALVADRTLGMIPVMEAISKANPSGTEEIMQYFLSRLIQCWIAAKMAEDGSTKEQLLAELLPALSLNTAIDEIKDSLDDDAAKGGDTPLHKAARIVLRKVYDTVNADSWYYINRAVNDISNISYDYVPDNKTALDFGKENMLTLYKELSYAKELLTNILSMIDIIRGFTIMTNVSMYGQAFNRDMAKSGDDTGLFDNIIKCIAEEMGME